MQRTIDRIGWLAAAFVLTGCGAWAESPSAHLKLVQVIALPEVKGRIDHLTVDVKRRRVILSALGSDAVEIVDAFAGRVHATIRGLALPQGSLYVPGLDKLFVANSASGKVHIYDGTTYQLRGVVDFGENPDNVRWDAAAQRVYVGYGDGAIGAIDARTERRLDVNFPMGEHPESFQLEQNGPNIYVNVAKLRHIAVINRSTGAITKWPIRDAGMNFPMALDEASQRLYIGTRVPARMKVFDTATGKELASLPVGADMDDLMIDAVRKRIYVAGADGYITVVQQVDANHWQVTGSAPSRAGARTAIFYPQRDRIYLAVPSMGEKMAGLWVYAPQE